MKMLRKAVCYFVLMFSFVITGYGQSKIISIEAKLFYNQARDSDEIKEEVAGKLSQNVIDNPDFILWNTDIGAGSAAGVSTQSILVVGINSKNLSNKKQTVRLTAYQGKKILLQQQKTFICIGDNVLYKIAFLLDDNECSPLSVKAEIIKNGKIISTLRKSIDFQCGE